MRKKIILLAVVILVILKFCGAFDFKKDASKNEATVTESTVAATDTKSANSASSAKQQVATSTSDNQPAAEAKNAANFSDSIDMGKWKYNAQDEVYYQLNITYCKNPADEKYEQLALFVPKNFLKCEKNGAETFSCQPDKSEVVGSFTSDEAPFIIPVESPKYAPNPALNQYQSYKKYTDAGFIYAHVGFRGKEHGAPAGLVDLKAAIRYLRHNQKILPGHTDYIFPFGSGEGAGLSILLGTSANSQMFRPYLQSIGAIDGGSDKVYGVMAWSPITNLDTANIAYEWNMGMTRKKLSEAEKQLSDKMAREYANYVNNTGFLDSDKSPLILQFSERGIFQEGTYYDHVKQVVEDSAAEYIEGTNFPHRVSEKETATFKGEINMAGYYMDKEKYLKALNEKHNWVQYNFFQRTAIFRSIEDFARSFEPADKNIGAFDPIDRSTPENILFGDGKGHGYHFDAYMAKIFKNTPEGKEYLSDLRKQDAFGNSVQQRLNMYTPLYYIMSAYDGYRTAGVSPFWRIRSGVNQSELSLTADINLALALRQYPKVADVDFRAVWNAGRTKAEDLGADADEAFIKWVTQLMHRYYAWDVKD